MSWEPKDPWGQQGGSDPLDDVLKKAQDQWQRMMPNKGMKTIILIVVAVLALSQAVFKVEPDEEGLVKRFGDVVRTVGPGPHLKVPFIETVVTPKVEKLHRIEVGFRTNDRGRTQIVPQEALMLTGDMNILSVEFIIQYKISKARDYLFNVADIEETIRKAAEASMREVVGKNKIDEVLTVGKAEIQQKTQDLLQGILDQYEGGTQIASVQLLDVNPPQKVAKFFKDVASAKEEREQLINQAHGYRNDIIPKAKGQAAQDINQAKGFAQSRLARAEGEANHFLQTLEEYRKGKNVIGKRVYIETMEEVLSNVDKIILDSKASGNVLPYLPLDRMKRFPKSNSQATP
ncbi:FtsH protease activity modulator HflK [Candidatus Nitronereus thalassa]|uniref:Protein HflK n=1 Tax=Candidatus Nitronereus thalassa TaxID=3020898 RepID=A0ABU3KCI5_9BACT|nr:FtsH protease activity modulator HflK [Candidatus Nitronereus thalassa]MDT7043887.1 FtsH protease activity modulator HflK [Candidatus Nitronereus thalassa]